MVSSLAIKRHRFGLVGYTTFLAFERTVLEYYCLSKIYLSSPKPQTIIMRICLPISLPLKKLFVKIETLVTLGDALRIKNGHAGLEPAATTQVSRLKPDPKISALYLEPLYAEGYTRRGIRGGHSATEQPPLRLTYVVFSRRVTRYQKSRIAFPEYFSRRLLLYSSPPGRFPLLKIGGVYPLDTRYLQVSITR